MKLFILSITALILSSCASSPEVSPEVRQYCTKVCQDQNMRFFGAEEDQKCICAEKPERFFLDRHSNSRN